VGKRSPILGFNHNVRYRGLVFHVQTEDSGVATPHLFTHLFHSGVIVSTRKLVYDAGSAEESIKSLMQAQHKATLKDLRHGHFDDKIDSYLGGTPGLLPRGTEGASDRPADIELAPSQGTVEGPAIGAPTEQVLPMTFDDLSDTVMVLENAPSPGRPTKPPVPLRPTAERSALPGDSRGTSSVLDTTLKTKAPLFDSSAEIELVPEIDLQLDLDDVDNDEAVPMPRRANRDTETQLPYSEFTRPTLDVRLDDHTRPTVGTLNAEARRASTISDGIPGSLRPSSPALQPPPTDSRRLGERPSTINAATLPPARPIARPPARPSLAQSPVVSRAATSDDRSRRESDAAEVYSPPPPPPPPSAELPPGERPGQYAQHKKVSTRIPLEGIKNERSGSAPIPAGLGRPQRSGPLPTTGKPGAAASPPGSPPPSAGDSSSQMEAHAEPVRARAPTPARIAPPSSTPNRTAASANSGVVMTRPAVIVGAPSKPVATMPRIRKAREDEGRGFGQGLISEKSLDEVILAYLSEDADEK
jgi:hypothetical protein